MVRPFLIALLLVTPLTAVAASESVRLYKSPSGGCCSAYVDYLRENGFDVVVIPMPDMAQIKAEQGVPRPLASCHTSIIEGYVFEGHIPVRSVHRVLDQRPTIAGISVPGMLMGSPGIGIERGLAEPLRVYDLGGVAYATYRRIPR
ncbi:Uncharacterized conserved protein [Modicisalibacter muralis]|uniref:Uncharacterized conserved protein n=1 Tax=Modicisalibacter muralis TaxID=119000 RepID=A0A1G9LJV0_9GAMM|nr:DUF411 domain-containing protein [Halomonas muralis]SDL62221.1 Uncharacterized conserved protein [Halomonas muralis]